MYKLLLPALVSFSLVGCGEELVVTEDSASTIDTLQLGSAIPTTEVNPTAKIELEESTQYEWSVRAVTDLGAGEWSSGLQFSIHADEEAAFADAISKDDSSADYEPGLYSDSLPVPTVVSSSPIGSIYQPEPTFKWEPVNEAITYEVRILDVDTGAEVYTEYYFTQDVCQNDTCELRSDQQETATSPAEVPGTSSEIDIVDTFQVVDVTETVNEVDTVDVVDVTDSVNEVDVVDTFQVVDVTETVNEVDVVDTFNVVEVTDTINEEVVTDTVNEVEVTDTVSEVDVTDNVNAIEVTNNVNEVEVTDNVNEEEVTETVNEVDEIDTVSVVEATDSVNEVEVTDTADEVEVTDAANEGIVTELVNEVEVTDAIDEVEVTDAINEVDATDTANEEVVTETPTETVVENQEPTDTPELGAAIEEQATVEQTQAPAQTNVAVNSEIEALQRSEGVLAFPGALGYAKNSVGGRGARVVVVNTTENIVNSSDNLMSLREATTIESGPRTIVFSVGGVFDTGTSELHMSGEADSNVTVACQTAPAPGVVMKTFGFSFQNGVHDLVFRHCGVRLISIDNPIARTGRNITVRGGSRNIMLDHMSFAWATDENFQAYLDPNQSVGIENITVSNSAVVEGDADSAHPESVEHHSWSYHAMGPSCNNTNPNRRISGCSIVNNFIAHNSSRNAMIWGGDGELKNNIIYNWYGIGLTVQPHGGGNVNAIIDNNLMKAGASARSANTNPNCGPGEYRCAMYLGASNSKGTSRYLVGDNYYIPQNQSFDDAVRINHPNANTPAGTPQFDSATNSPTPVLEMAAQGSRFMACVGASRPERDHIDTRVIQEFYAGTGKVGIGENIRTGGHNATQQRTWNLFGPDTAHPAGYDTDNDGMPDQWENAYGLNPNDGSDHSGDLDSDGYTNLEEYLAIAAHC